MLTTRSGSRAASEASQRSLPPWLGVRCRSLTCSTLIGLAPGRQARRPRPGAREAADLDPGGVREARDPPQRRADAPCRGRSQAARDVTRAGATWQGCHNGLHERLKDRLRADLTAAIKARDEVRSSTLRMVLTAITNAEVAGKEARELTDDDVLGVLTSEAKKRREAAEAFDDAGRDGAGRQGAGRGRGDRRLPARAAHRRRDRRAGHHAIASSACRDEGMRAMGRVMGALTPKTKGRADGGVVAAEVRRQLVERAAARPVPVAGVAVGVVAVAGRVCGGRGSARRAAASCSVVAEPREMSPAAGPVRDRSDGRRSRRRSTSSRKPADRARAAAFASPDSRRRR